VCFIDIADGYTQNSIVPRSLGLAVTPRLRFLRGKASTGSTTGEPDAKRSKLTAGNARGRALDFGLDEDGDDPSAGADDLFVVRRVSSADDYQCDSNAGDEAEDGVDRETTKPGDQGAGMGRGTRRRVVTRAAIARKILKKKIQVNVKGRFDDDDVAAASDDGARQALNIGVSPVVMRTVCVLCVAYTVVM